MSDAPTNIRALQADQILELTWDESLVARLPYHYLRGECPCASCRDEWTGERIVDPATLRPDLKLEGMEGVGNYAVRLAWSDGHGTGLYTWDLLRRLCRDCPFSQLGIGPDASSHRGKGPSAPDADSPARLDQLDPSDR